MRNGMCRHHTGNIISSSQPGWLEQMCNENGCIALHLRASQVDLTGPHEYIIDIGSTRQLVTALGWRAPLHGPL